MITIILIALGLLLLSKMNSTNRHNAELARLQRIRNEDIAERERMRKSIAQHDTSIEQIQKEQIQAAKERAQLEKEQARQAEALRKHEKRISDLEFKIEQAEADILNEQSKLDHYTSKLSELDEQIEKIDRDIEYFQLANKVDAEAKAWANRNKIEDKIFNFEQKVKGCEKRMSKAEHIRRQAQSELEEVA